MSNSRKQIRSCMQICTAGRRVLHSWASAAWQEIRPQLPPRIRLESPSFRRTCAAQSNSVTGASSSLRSDDRGHEPWWSPSSWALPANTAGVRGTRRREREWWVRALDAHFRWQVHVQLWFFFSLEICLTRFFSLQIPVQLYPFFRKLYILISNTNLHYDALSTGDETLKCWCAMCKSLKACIMDTNSF